MSRRGWLVILAVVATGCSRLFPGVGQPGQPERTVPPLEATAAVSATAIPTVAAPTTMATGDIAHLLANRPAAGAPVEIEAYTGYSGDPSAFPFGTDWSGYGRCPMAPGHLLADQPFVSFYTYGHTTGTSNALPPDAPWLAAVAPASDAYPPPTLSLPFHARLRGHLGDAAYAQCEPADRIFVVDEVLADLGDMPPHVASADEVYGAAPTWPRYTHPEQGYSVPVPPGWSASVLPDGSLALADPRWPGTPVVVRRSDGEYWQRDYLPDEGAALALPADCRGTGGSGGRFAQPDQHSADATAPAPLAGVLVSSDGTNRACLRIALNHRGRHFLVAVDYPLGFGLPQPLLWDYTAIADNLAVADPATKTPPPLVTGTPLEQAYPGDA
jgi:hypothetical protein